MQILHVVSGPQEMPDNGQFAEQGLAQRSLLPTMSLEAGGLHTPFCTLQIYATCVDKDQTVVRRQLHNTK